MQKSDLFRKPHFKGDDFPQARIMTITGVRQVEVFIPNAGAKERRWVVTVKEDPRYIFLSEALFDNIVGATGSDDTDDWAGKTIQVYQVQVSVQGKARWGVRARRAVPEPAAGARAPERQLPTPITDTAPKRPYSPQTLLKGFQAQYAQHPPAWKAAVMPKGVRTRVCIGFKALVPGFNADELKGARHAICAYLCDGRNRLEAGADNGLSWADGKVLLKWLFTGELSDDGRDTPCKLAAKEALTILAFVGFFDDKEPVAREKGAEKFVEAAVQEAVEMLGAIVTEEAPPAEEDEDEAPF